MRTISVNSERWNSVVQTVSSRNEAITTRINITRDRNNFRSLDDILRLTTDLENLVNQYRDVLRTDIARMRSAEVMMVTREQELSRTFREGR